MKADLAVSLFGEAAIRAGVNKKTADHWFARNEIPAHRVLAITEAHRKLDTVGPGETSMIGPGTVMVLHELERKTGSLEEIQKLLEILAAKPSLIQPVMAVAKEMARL